jgi:hypothetical protein
MKGCIEMNSVIVVLHGKYVFIFEVVLFVGCVNKLQPKGMRQLGCSTTREICRMNCDSGIWPNLQAILSCELGDMFM